MHIFFMTGCGAIQALNSELESYTEAAEDAYWHVAMEEETTSALAVNETWDLVDAPKGVKLIICRWVYKVNRYKA